MKLEISVPGYAKDSPLRAPEVTENDRILADEHGRIFKPADGSSPGVSYESHAYRLVKDGPIYALLVRHASGDERLPLGARGPALALICDKLASDERYTLFHAIFTAASNKARTERDKTAASYEKAFVEGRLKKRKQGNRTVVEIAAPIIAAAA